MNDATTFLELLLSGKYLPAIGVALIAIVALMRTGLAGFWPWFATKPGGYLLGFGTAALLYVGEAWRSGAGLSIGVLTAALGTGWAASGGFEMVRDLLTWWRSRSRPPIPPAKIVSMLIVASVLLVACSSCREIKDSKPVAALVDCTVANRDKIEIVGVELLAVLGNGGGWGAVRDHAIETGVSIGGCAFVELVQSYLMKRGVSAEDGWTARSAFEEYRRTTAGNATFMTAAGAL